MARRKTVARGAGWWTTRVSKARLGTSTMRFLSIAACGLHASYGRARCDRIVGHDGDGLADSRVQRRANERFAGGKAPREY